MQRSFNIVTAMEVRNATGLTGTDTMDSTFPQAAKGYVAEVIEALAASVGVAPQKIAQGLGCAHPQRNSHTTLKAGCALLVSSTGSSHLIDCCRMSGIALAALVFVCLAKARSSQSGSSCSTENAFARHCNCASA